MTDQPSKLEQELLAMRPRPIRGDMLDEISQSMKQTRRVLSDWCLIGAMGSGLAAACVIGAMLSIQLFESVPSPVFSAAPVAQIAPQRAGDSLVMFARADGEWTGIVK